uniref:Uncharacterized protein n=2 Tax=Mycobacteriaceae TaxID=1762 RepID=A4TFS9_MYCGI
MGEAMDELATALRVELCRISTSARVRVVHLGALLAFTPSRRVGGGLHFEFAHQATARWVLDTLVEPTVCSPRPGVVHVPRPRETLQQYGLHEDGRWTFGRGLVEAEGIGRGAVHAASRFTRHGMKVCCPSVPMMLTLATVLGRLGIETSLLDNPTRVGVRAAETAEALTRLGAAGAGERYRVMRDLSCGGALTGSSVVDRRYQQRSLRAAGMGS